jgi:S-adenosylmethionine-diacylglycerol 3-amino-3-carboxypropyl transferase
MSTKVLLGEAVYNSTSTQRKGLLDRIFTLWFNRLVYPQIWEDPIVDMKALGLDEKTRMVTISSGGCNALSYLTRSPAEIHVVDLNEAHIALINLKMAAVRHFETHEQFFDFFGYADKKSNLALYETYLKPHLDEKTRAYWEGKPFLGRARKHYFTDNFYRHGLLGKFISLGHWLTRRLVKKGDLTAIMQAKTQSEAGQIFDERVAPVFDHWLVKWLARRPVVLYSLGIPHAQYQEMEKASVAQAEGIEVTLKNRLRHLAADFPLEDNYFAWQAFSQHYDTEHRQGIPEYLKAEYFATLKANADRLAIEHTSMTTYLEGLGEESLNAYVFLDAQDWMDEAQLNALWTEVTRTAQHNAVVICRSAAKASPLETKLDASIKAQWVYEEARSQALWKEDRSAIYDGFHIYRRR